MPLPKTSSIAARATEVYAEVWSAALQTCWGLPPLRPNDLSDLSRLLPYLRQLLTCCACAGLLADAMTSLACGHCYCHACQFCPPLLKIQCRQCRERTGLVVERQLRVVVEGYRHLCRILGNHRRQNPDSVELSMEDGFDAVGEILAEVEQGKKVTRCVLVIKPPEKYLRPPSAPTPKKDPGSRAVASSLLSSRSPRNASPDPSQSSEVTLTGDDSDGDGTRHFSAPGSASAGTRRHRARRKEGRTRSHKGKGSAGSRSRRRQLAARGDRERRSVSRQNGDRSSEEEIDVMSTESVANEQSLRVSIPSLPVAGLQVDAGCFNSAYVGVSSLVVQVGGASPAVRSAIGPPPPDWAALFPGVSVAATPHRSRAPLCPRVLQHRDRTGDRQRLSAPNILPSYRDFPKPRVRKSRSKKLVGDKLKRSTVLVKTSTGPVGAAGPVSMAGPVDVAGPVSVAGPVDVAGPVSVTTPEGGVLLLGDMATDTSFEASPGSPTGKKAKLIDGPRSVLEKPPRCRCGTNYPQFLENICARNKCPCYSRGRECARCLCRHCHNPFND